MDVNPAPAPQAPQPASKELIEFVMHHTRAVATIMVAEARLSQAEMDRAMARKRAEIEKLDHDKLAATLLIDLPASAFHAC
jgi:hypothetical protein